MSAEIIPNVDIEEAALLARLSTTSRHAQGVWKQLRGARAAVRAVDAAAGEAGERLPLWARTALTGTEAAAYAAFAAAHKEEIDAQRALSAFIDRRIAAASAAAGQLAAGQVTEPALAGPLPWIMADDKSHWRAQLPDGRTAVIRRVLGQDGESSLLFTPVLHESASDFVTGPQYQSVLAAANWVAEQVTL